MLNIEGELSTKQIIRLTVPLFMEQIVLLGLPVINAILVSSAGQAALSGVSLVDQINTMLTYLFLYSMSGISIIAAQYFGRNDKGNLKLSIQQAFAASNILSVAVMLLMLVSGNSILKLFIGGADAQILVEAGNYFRILVFSYPFFSFYSVSVATLRGIGSTRSAMVVSIVQNTMTIAFSSVLIYVFHLGVYGAALGMIGGRMIGSALGAILLYRTRAVDHFRDMFKLNINLDMQRKIIKFGFPSSVEAILFMLAKVIINMFILKAGIDQVAAYAAASPISDLQVSGASSFIIISTTIVAYAKGSNDNELAKKYLKKVFLLITVTLVVTELAFLPFLPQLLSVYNLSDVSFHLALKMLIIHAVMQILTYPSAFMLQAAFKGAGDVVVPSVVSMLAIWLIRLPIAYVFAYVLGWGTFGLFIGMWSDFIVRAAISLIRWRSGKWLKHESV